MNIHQRLRLFSLILGIAGIAFMTTCALRTAPELKKHPAAIERILTAKRIDSLARNPDYQMGLLLTASAFILQVISIMTWFLKLIANKSDVCLPFILAVIITLGGLGLWTYIASSASQSRTISITKTLTTKLLAAEKQLSIASHVAKTHFLRSSGAISRKIPRKNELPQY
jgi:hypothetical protein